MLGKLIKYDLMFGSKKYLLMGALLLALLVTMLVVSLIGNEVLIVLTIVLAAIASIAYLVMYLVISVQHLYQQLVKRESYLSYTLPVTTNQLLLSKLLTITIWGAALTVAIIVFWFTAVDRMLVWQLNTSLYQEIAAILPDAQLTGQFIFSILLQTLSGMIYSMGMLAFSISLVNIPWLKVKGMGVAAAVLFWIFGGQVISFIQLFATGRTHDLFFSASWIMEASADTANSYNSWASAQPALTSTFFINSAFSLVLGIGLYIAAINILKRRRQI